MSPSYHHISAACLEKAKRHATGGSPARSGPAGDAPSGLVHLIRCYNVPSRKSAPRRRSVEFTPCNSILIHTVTKVKTSHHGKRALHSTPSNAMPQTEHLRAKETGLVTTFKKRDSNQPPLQRKCGKQNRRTPSCHRNTSQTLSKLAVI